MKALSRHPLSDYPIPVWNNGEKHGSLLACLAYANDSCPCPPAFQAGMLAREREMERERENMPKPASNYSIGGGPSFHNVNKDLVANNVFIQAIITRTTRG